MGKPPSIKLIAELLGLSQMTVSRALRDVQSVGREVREKVRETARSLGYQADARVSNVMSALRKSEVPQYREKLAFVWTHSSAGQAGNSSLNEAREGARRRALELGYQLEDFPLSELNVSGRELSETLQSRGIRGVLIAPGPRQLRLEWRRFCCVLVGSSSGTEGLTCIEHDPYFGCVLAIRRLKRVRYRRVGLVLSRATDLGTSHLIQSAFINFHQLGAEEARKLIFISDTYQPRQLNKWLEKAKPEILLTQFEDTFPRKEQLLAHAPRGTELAALNWSAQNPEIAGVNQHYAHIGETAVNVLLERLQQGSLFGLDPAATSIKIPGSWVAAKRT
jgi:DNA-binding LacI/PurR family transcriptional regulator